MATHPQLPATNLDKGEPASGTADEADVLRLILGYKTEAEEARKGGPDGRDAVWQANVDLYWGRVDFSKKAEWQARVVMPEASVFVDRWAAAMSEALTSTEDWFSVVLAGDTENDLAPGIKRFMKAHLRRAGRDQLGHPIRFPKVFEEQMKLGAMMAACGSVTWKERGGKGYVAVEAFDPRAFWMDHTGRGLYRIRRTEIDLHELVRLANTKDGTGKALYNLEAINRLVATITTEATQEAEKSSGTGQQISSARKPITLHEFLCTILDDEGKIVSENQLVVLANDTEIIRGPEPNPFWHERDWMLFNPLITVPLSPYGRSYMENWAGIAVAFTDMTNLILDGTRAAALNAFAGDASKLEDPTQLTDGITPNMFLQLEEGADAKAFIEKIELGRLPREVVVVWQALKKEMQEGASQSEIALGQFPQKSRISATEIERSGEGSNAMVVSMARTIEGGFLEPELDLIWRTALQHMDPTKDQEIAEMIGVETYQLIFSQREALARSDVQFPVMGISGAIRRGQLLRRMLDMLQVVGQSEPLTAVLLQTVGPEKLFKELMRLFEIDLDLLTPTPREQAISAATEVPGQVEPAPATAPRSAV